MFRSEIEKYFKMSKNVYLPDFGCDNANDSGKYIFNDFYKYNGIDIHRGPLENARKFFGSKNISFLLKSSKKKYNIIFISEVLEHLEDPENTLIFLNKILQDDRTILRSVPNGNGLTKIEKYVINKSGIYKFFRFIYRILKNKQKKKNTIPFNYKSGYLKNFTISSLNIRILNSELHIEYFKNISFRVANIPGSTIFGFNFIKTLNTKIIDFLSSFLCVNWNFKLEEVK